mmetsp:Transcript_59033/g.66839  ORF Transcript_59033/g.66839 Transcript_59033/m.66839 type:complete len:170 (+) Transcript_59033:345-854(+)
MIFVVVAVISQLKNHSDKRFSLLGTFNIINSELERSPVQFRESRCRILAGGSHGQFGSGSLTVDQDPDQNSCRATPTTGPPHRAAFSCVAAGRRDPPPGSPGTRVLLWLLWLLFLSHHSVPHCAAAFVMLSPRVRYRRASNPNLPPAPQTNRTATGDNSAVVFAYCVSM